MCFRVKYYPGGQIERHKERLVAKGYSQIEGIDFAETFSPVLFHKTLRCTISLAAMKQMQIHQMDVETTFLN